MTSLEPASIPELVETIRSRNALRIEGAGTKPRLSAGTASLISIRKLRGLLEYEPAEFTFTALAGTPVKEIETALAERGQYLPFDPMLVESGSTLGGTVASGLSGPGRFRFGGIRDFILGIRFIDGKGRLLRMGSKVVKSAAGFDLPKFFVGSLGRFGVLVELTFKVFPCPPARLSLQIPADDLESVGKIFVQASKARWQPEAMDMLPGDRSVYLRLAGPVVALDKMSAEILQRWPGKVLPADAAEKLWSRLREFRWAHPDGPLLKIPITPATFSAVCRAMSEKSDARIHISSGGNLAFISLSSESQVDVLDKNLSSLGLPALALRGTSRLGFGARRSQEIAASVKRTLDPDNKFPSLDN